MKKVIYPLILVIFAIAISLVVVLKLENESLKRRVFVLSQDNVQVRGEWVHQRLQLIAKENAFEDARVVSRGGGGGIIDSSGFHQTGRFQVEFPVSEVGNRSDDFRALVEADPAFAAWNRKANFVGMHGEIGTKISEIQGDDSIFVTFTTSYPSGNRD